MTTGRGKHREWQACRADRGEGQQAVGRVTDKWTEGDSNIEINRQMSRGREPNIKCDRHKAEEGAT
jgi:hypothetical protein